MWRMSPPSLLAREVIVPSKIPHSQGKRTNRSSLSLHKFKELFRYLRIAASDVDPVVLPLPPLLLLPPLSSAIVRGPGELAVATIGVAHGGLAIGNRARMFSHSHCLPLLLLSSKRPQNRSSSSVSQSIWPGKINRRHFSRDLLSQNLAECLKTKELFRSWVRRRRKLLLKTVQDMF